MNSPMNVILHSNKSHLASYVDTDEKWHCPASIGVDLAKKLGSSNKMTKKYQKKKKKNVLPIFKALPTFYNMFFQK